MSLFLNTDGVSSLPGSRGCEKRRSDTPGTHSESRRGIFLEMGLLGLSVMKSACSISIPFGTLLVVSVHLFILSTSI